MDACPICRETLADGRATVCLKEKGSTGINNASNLRNDSVTTSPGMYVHVTCRREYIHPRNIDKDECVNASKRTLRSCEEMFDFKTKCLFCSKPAKYANRKRGNDVFPVRSLEFQQTIRKHCSTRCDAWANDVFSRLSAVIDLPAAEAVYHQSCNVNFRTGKQIPKAFQEPEASIPNDCTIKSPGRPEESEQLSAFLQIIEFIESNENEIIVVNDLVKMMTSICGEKAYTSKHMKRKIIEHFGESVVIGLDGKHDIITLKQTASSIIHSFYSQSKSSSEDDEKLKIIYAAAKLVRNDIYSIKKSKEYYPSFSDIASVDENVNYLPHSLNALLIGIFSGKGTKTKVASIGQSIIQTCRPKKIQAPLQLALSVQLHHHFGSRYLIDLLNSLGFCASYWQTQKFESSAAATLNTSLPNKDTDNTFLQFVADNVDHNICTLDGNNTFHGMGIIACTTPASGLSVRVPRLDISLEELSKIGKIDVKYFTAVDEHIDPTSFAELPDKYVIPTYPATDIFSKLIWPLRPSRPSWSGFMQMFEVGAKQQHTKSSISFMPMIDLNPSDLTCINSTLHFVCDQAGKHGVTPVVTFDQPLFQKASFIISSQNQSSHLRKIVLRLGGFHTQMSFLGCIGHLMSGSGLQEAIETVYASNAVTHIMTGKAIQRAVRAHMLVDTVLHTLVMENVFKTEFSLEENASEKNVTDSETSDNSINKMVDTNVENRDGNSAIKKLGQLFDKLQTGKMTLKEVCESDTLEMVGRMFQEGRNNLISNRTTKLWFLYMDMINILQQFIRAERTGNWQQHLACLRKMLPFFAASGHNLYLKSAYIYLQNMLKLEQTNPDVHAAFLNGCHVIRRSDRYWAGLSTDLVIEQVLMRSLKTSGGLTRGRGMTEQQRALWLMSMPICVEVNNAMQEFSGTTYTSSDQHKETGKARILRDKQDMCLLLDFLRERSPFQETDSSLRNIETGVTANKDVNVDCAEGIGEKIVQEMAGQCLQSYSFKRSSQAVTLNDKSAINITGEHILLDTQLLFQRLTTAASRFVEDVSEIFQYELCSIPSSLFDNSGLLRESQKSTLADVLWKLGDCSFDLKTSSFDESERMYVIDGGSLIQKFPWVKGSTFGEICNQYKSYLQQKYKRISVVFDGYSSGPSTKDVTHLRRTKGAVGTAVRFSYDTPFRSQKDVFLRNKENKQNFILLLGECLLGNGMTVHHASGDADCLIVDVAVDISQNDNVAVIGEDTDLLVLLCYHVQQNSKNVVFKSDSRKNKKVPKIWDINKTKQVLGADICCQLPFLHALTGCDTTSRVFGISKACVVKTFQKNIQFQTVCRKFTEAVNRDDIQRYGIEALSVLFGSPACEDLNMLRYKRFSSKVISCTSSLQVQSLPPTKNAAKYHCLRVYYQTLIWMGTDININPLDYGWELVDGMMMPIKTDLPPAPEKLLQIIRCNCKINCDNKRCTCRKHGLDCSIGCGECRGIACSNSPCLSDIELLIEDDMS